MPELLDLPNGILLEIFEKVAALSSSAQYPVERWDSAEERHRFAALALVNHAFHEFTTPILYRSFAPGEDYGPRCRDATFCWARTLLENDRKARCVENIVLQFCHIEVFNFDEFLKSQVDENREEHVPDEGSPEHQHSERQVSVQELPQVEILDLDHLDEYRSRKIRARGPNTTGKANVQKLLDNAFKNDADLYSTWKTHHLSLSGDRMNYFLVLAIVSLPRLRLLHLRGCWVATWSNLLEIVEKLNSYAETEGGSRPLGTLKSAILGNHSKHNLSVVASSLAIAITSLNCHTLVGESVADFGEYRSGYTPGFNRILAKSSEVKAIELRPECQLHPFNLYKLVGAPKNLQSFKYHLGVQSHGRLNITETLDALKTLRTGGIMRALAQQQNNLREICLTHGVWSLGLAEVSQPEWSPMNFSGFIALRRLEIKFQMFFGCSNVRDLAVLSLCKSHVLNALPTSLITFGIVQQTDDAAIEATMAAFDAMVSARDEYFPVLEGLIIAPYRRMTLAARSLVNKQDWAKKSIVTLTLQTCENCRLEGLSLTDPEQADEYWNSGAALEYKWCCSKHGAIDSWKL